MKPHPSPFTTIALVVGIILLAVAPPLGLLLLGVAWMLQRHWRNQRRTVIRQAQARAYQRRQRERILAFKSLP